MRNKYNQGIQDLSSHYVILGSGLSAVAAINGILDTTKNDNKKIFVIDAGISKETFLNLDSLVKRNVLPSPKFKIKANRYLYESFKGLVNLNEEGFQAIGSLAKGGLSNLWGAGIQPYTEIELSQFPYSYEKIWGIYSRIYKILTGTDGREFHPEAFRSVINSFEVCDPLLAINVKNGGGRSCHLKSCDNGCICCNKNIYNSRNEIDHLINSKKIEYLPSLFVKSIDYQDGHYIINCVEVPSQKVVALKATIVFSCLGAISTSKVVLGMSKKDAKVPFFNTPGGSFFMFSFRLFHKKKHKILSSQTFKGNVVKNYFEGNIFPFSENLVVTYFGEGLGKILNSLFGKLVFSRLFIANIYFSSDLSSASFESNDDQITIRASITSDLRKVFKRTMKLIKKELFLEGLFVLPFGKKLLSPGQDIHYGGSIPMKKNPGENQCDFNGELYGFKNFYVTDSASMPFLAPKGHSFNSMVNAYYIASKSVELQADKIKI